jgi:transposase
MRNLQTPVRNTVFLAVLCSLRRSSSKKMKDLYDKKIAEGKPHKVAMVACVKVASLDICSLRSKEAFLDLD